MSVTPLKSQSGYSLVGALITVAMIAITIPATLSFFSGYQKSLRRTNQSAELEQLRQYLRLAFDCTNTMNALPNPPSSPGRVVGGQEDSTVPLFGKYKERPLAPQWGNQVFRAQLGTVAGEFLIQYLDKQKSKEGTWKPLFQVPFACQ